MRSPEALYDKSLLTVDSNSYYRQALITKLFPKVIDLYGQLQQQADKNISSTLDNQYLDLADESWFLQDWHDLKQSEKQLQIAQKQIEQAQEQIEQLNSLLCSIDSSKLGKLRRWWSNLKQKFNIMRLNPKVNLNKTKTINSRI